MAVFSWSGRVYAVDLSRGRGQPARGGGARARRWIRGPTRPGSGWPTSAPARCGWPAWPEPRREDQVAGGPAGRAGRDVRAGRVHRGRGDGPAPRLLVVPGRLGAAGGAGGRDAGAPVAHRRPGQPGTPARRGGLSRGRHPERRGVPRSWPGWTAPPWTVRDRPRRVPLPGHRLLGGRARPAGRGAEPGPAHDAAAVRRRRHRPGQVLHEDTDPHWLEIVPGVPAWTADGRLVWTADREDTRRLLSARRCPAGAGAGHPARPAGARGARRRRRHRAVPGVAEPTEVGLWATARAG